MNVALAKTDTGTALGEAFALARPRLPGAGKVADTAKDVAANVSSTAKDVAGNVTSTAKDVRDQAGKVASDLRDRGEALVDNAVITAGEARDKVLDALDDEDDDATAAPKQP